jgi:hypothetical protein
MAGNVPLSQIALCCIADVKNLLDPKLSGDQDAILVQLINMFSRMVQGERYLNRKLLLQKYTEVYDGGSALYFVEAPPIQVDGDFTVTVAEDGSFQGVDPLVLNDHFSVNWENGVIRARTDWMTDNPASVQIIYNGGLVLNNEADPANVVIPDDLRGAAAMQVSFWYQRRRELGISSITTAGGDAVFYAPTQLLPIVTEIIGQYRLQRVWG